MVLTLEITEKRITVVKCGYDTEIGDESKLLQLARMRLWTKITRMYEKNQTYIRSIT